MCEFNQCYDKNFKLHSDWLNQHMIICIVDKQPVIDSSHVINSIMTDLLIVW